MFFFLTLLEIAMSIIIGKYMKNTKDGVHLKCPVCRSSVEHKAPSDQKRIIQAGLYGNAMQWVVSSPTKNPAKKIVRNVFTNNKMDKWRTEILKRGGTSPQDIQAIKKATTGMLNMARNFSAQVVNRANTWNSKNPKNPKDPKSQYVRQRD